MSNFNIDKSFNSYVTNNIKIIYVCPYITPIVIHGLYISNIDEYNHFIDLFIEKNNTWYYLFKWHKINPFTTFDITRSIILVPGDKLMSSCDQDDIISINGNYNIIVE